MVGLKKLGVLIGDCQTCFDGVMPSDRFDIIFQICHYIDYWKELQKTRTKKALQRGADQNMQWIEFVRNQCVWSLVEGGKALSVNLKLNLCCFFMLLFSAVRNYLQCGDAAADWWFALSML
jgi:hypothetical protein